MTAFFGNNYSFKELREILTSFKKSPRDTLSHLKTKGYDRGLVYKLQQKL